MVGIYKRWHTLRTQKEVLYARRPQVVVVANSCNSSHQMYYAGAAAACTVPAQPAYGVPAQPACGVPAQQQQYQMTPLQVPRAP